ncbi:MAG: hypothetical protein IT198_07105 [Acidimicrobiia bacterium]|nr:hypothetical protein [Acidimicrobiia bacterium]
MSSQATTRSVLRCATLVLGAVTTLAACGPTARLEPVASPTIDLYTGSTESGAVFSLTLLDAETARVAVPHPCGEDDESVTFVVAVDGTRIDTETQREVACPASDTEGDVTLTIDGTVSGDAAEGSYGIRAAWSDPGSSASQRWDEELGPFTWRARRDEDTSVGEVSIARIADPDMGSIAATDDAAWVIADGGFLHGSSLFRADASTGELSRVGPGFYTDVVAATPSAVWAFASDPEAETMSLARYDPASGDNEATVEIDGEGCLRDLVAAGTRAWVVNACDGLVWRVDAASDRATGPSRPAEGALADARIEAIAAAPDRLWVVARPSVESGTIAYGIDAETLDVVAEVPLGLSVESDERAFAVDGYLVVPTPRGPVRVETGTGTTQLLSSALAVALDGTALWTAAETGADMTELTGVDVTTGEGVDTVLVPARGGFAVSDGLVWAVEYGTGSLALTHLD